VNRAIPAKPIAFAAAVLFGLPCVALAQAGNFPFAPSVDERVYSLGEFNRLSAVSGIHTVEAHVVALAYLQCKPRGPCPAVVAPIAALISDTPGSRIRHTKVKSLIGQFRQNNLTATESALDKLQSGHAFRALDLKYDVKAEQPEPEKRYRLRIRTTSDARQYPTGLLLEDFCSVSDCAGRSERNASTRTHKGMTTWNVF
jgi:hypothetical protein